MPLFYRHPKSLSHRKNLIFSPLVFLVSLSKMWLLIIFDRVCRLARISLQTFDSELFFWLEILAHMTQVKCLYARNEWWPLVKRCSKGVTMEQLNTVFKREWKIWVRFSHLRLQLVRTVMRSLFIYVLSTGTSTRRSTRLNRCAGPMHIKTWVGRVLYLLTRIKKLTKKLRVFYRITQLQTKFWAAELTWTVLLPASGPSTYLVDRVCVYFVCPLYKKLRSGNGIW